MAKLKTSVKPVNKASKLDVFLWLVVLLLLVVGIWATYHYQALASALKLSAWIVLLLFCTGLIWKTTQGEKLYVFAKKSRAELRKVIWPTRQETIQATVMVAVIVLAVSVMLWLVDSGLVWVASWATGQKG